MNKKRSVDEVLEIMIYLASKEFGGKTCGRFRISRSKFRQLFGCNLLSYDTLHAFYLAAGQAGYMFMDVGDDFSFIELVSVKSYRPVPMKVLREFLSSDYAEDFDDEGDCDK